jgi:fructokinase
MLVGVDWGGTKIEALAIADDGRPIARLREPTPHTNAQ